MNTYKSLFMKLGSARVWFLVGLVEKPKAILMTEEAKEAEWAPVRFSDWKEALGKEALSVLRRDLFREAIVRFLPRSTAGVLINAAFVIASVLL